MASIERYKIPRAQVDVEQIAQDFFTYLRVTAEDAEILSHDVARRDALIAKLYANPAVKPSSMPDDMVGVDPSPEQYNDYLKHANAAIARLTPPKSLDDRVLRLHMAAAAMNVFREYKISYALQDHYDLKMKIFRRYNKLFSNWIKTEFPLISGRRRGQAVVEQAMRTPPTQRTPLSPPLMHHHGRAKAISAEEVADYLNNPHTLLRKQFRVDDPGDENDYKGLWTLESYTMRVREDQIDHEFVVCMEALNGAALPMGREEVEFLLRQSTVV
ncbi:hypothetical protein BD414DRAFT_404324 [Trametes punicea]|nr:hypothetical protein BD414DRAFT_404324 [Trametes punicea]